MSKVERREAGRLQERITVIPGATNDRDVIRRAVDGCDGVLVVLVPAACTITRRERLRPCSTTRSPGRGWCSRAGGTSVATAGTPIFVEAPTPAAWLSRLDQGNKVPLRHSAAAGAVGPTRR